MPNATVAAITVSSDATNADWLRARGPAGGGNLLGGALGLVAAGHVDDAGPRLLREQHLELRRNAVARPDVIADVRPIEAGDDQPVVRDAELSEDVRARPLVCRRG
jgi:hypothetical protein